MERLTPAELLRFLEEEADTLRLINAKIANQLHCLQVEEELFSRQLSKLEKESALTLAIESGQTGQDANDKLDTEDELESEGERLEQQSMTLVEYAEQALGSSPSRNLRQSPDLENEVQSEGLEQQLTMLVGATDQALESSPTPQQSTGSQSRSGGDEQELSQIRLLENDHRKEMEFQGQLEEQKVVRVRVKETPEPQRTSGRRISRRPARFQD